MNILDLNNDVFHYGVMQSLPLVDLARLACVNKKFSQLVRTCPHSKFTLEIIGLKKFENILYYMREWGNSMASPLKGDRYDLGRTKSFVNQWKFNDIWSSQGFQRTPSKNRRNYRLDDFEQNSDRSNCIDLSQCRRV